MSAVVTGMPSGAFVAALSRARVMAIIRGTDTQAAVATALALFDEGVRFVEISLTTPGAREAIEQVRAQLPEGAQIGAGTVLTAGDVADVESAGAQFVVTPAVTPSVAVAAARGLPVAAGALTPTEAFAAVQQGASAVKLFPASVGGPAYLKAVRDPFPHIPFLAVGGVGLDELRSYLAVGAVAVGVGSPLVGDAASGGDLEALRTRARAYTAAAERHTQ
ncbi:bifunctional 4-hydroxy-2-oxoglutarate aldolase/2-dehydro-3-deoxy-phosphogluconate aldolase [Knoellia sp. 3-2P3]|uniref:bifunctional 4-hydroxy-2-oxoglutarate aldolase/2-dehydro-3-deoxy-phosphogluconate aldolase n=1 Tax=unclassified Knoellia TaxID=2618719 RepID=UPI0023DB6B1D|nr:bifunctional 4-hydroxy-2-oxoglutarate aldolase/2-dehydro-3-deoxy-phosphogluconate aldolase [Knoellia sp. 3-2P3]MDF2091481.1 bifunctional 4-hydroxy-2-oxoglutarate aldolase/2-dehydro-3-deoxy-phosphogluconate aldolase [Knoellia sp. 3-2P3]